MGIYEEIITHFSVFHVILFYGRRVVIVVHGALRHQYLVTLGMIDPDMVESALPVRVAAVAQMALETRFGTGTGGGRLLLLLLLDRGGGGGGCVVIAFRSRIVRATGPVVIVIVIVVRVRVLGTTAVLLEMHPVDVSDQTLAFGERCFRARRTFVGGRVVDDGRRVAVWLAVGR